MCSFKLACVKLFLQFLLALSSPKVLCPIWWIVVYAGYYECWMYAGSMLDINEILDSRADYYELTILEDAIYFTTKLKWSVYVMLDEFRMKWLTDHKALPHSVWTGEGAN